MSAVYALNLFDVVNREEYLAYARRSTAEVAARGAGSSLSGSSARA